MRSLTTYTGVVFLAGALLSSCSRRDVSAKTNEAVVTVGTTTVKTQPWHSISR